MINLLVSIQTIQQLINCLLNDHIHNHNHTVQQHELIKALDYCNLQLKENNLKP